MKRHGFGAITPSTKGAGLVEEGVEFLRAHDILVHPRCRHLADELALYSYRIDPKTGAIGSSWKTARTTPSRGCGGAAMTAR